MRFSIILRNPQSSLNKRRRLDSLLGSGRKTEKAEKIKAELRNSKICVHGDFASFFSASYLQELLKAFFNCAKMPKILHILLSHTVTSRRQQSSVRERVETGPVERASLMPLVIGIIAKQICRRPTENVHISLTSEWHIYTHSTP